ncbi:hypothetical protein [Solibacillus sp. NPDC093137]|uniref:hypothetical protein n=1 Tax=Solibacillus sp. NPDC093137 TaxID=3390678 RepID=UPI003D004DC7
MYNNYETTGYTLENASKTSKDILSKHLIATELKRNVDQFIKIAVVGIGQAGGRIADEFAAYGVPTVVFNSSESDMKSLEYVHKKVFTPAMDADNYVIEGFQGAAKQRNLGKVFFEENRGQYVKHLNTEAFQDAQFVWICASLGGGTGSGAVIQTAELVLKIRAKYRYENYGKRIANSVGLIVVIPDEAGIEFKKNTVEAVAEINRLLYESGEDSIGSVLYVDNDHFNHSNAFADYSKNIDDKTDASKLSNAYVATLLMELNSLTALESNSTLDFNEFVTILGTPGHLYLQRSLQNNEFANELRDLVSMKDIASQANLQSISKKYAEEFVKIEGILNNNDPFINEKQRLGKSLMLGVLYPKDITENEIRKYVEELKAILPHSTAHVALSQISNNAQTGITTFAAYVTSDLPSRLNTILQDYEAEVEIANAREQERLAAIEAQKSKFANFASSSDNNFNFKPDITTDFSDLELEVNEGPRRRPSGSRPERPGRRRITDIELDNL